MDAESKAEGYVSSRHRRVKLEGIVSQVIKKDTDLNCPRRRCEGAYFYKPCSAVWGGCIWAAFTALPHCCFTPCSMHQARTGCGIWDFWCWELHYPSFPHSLITYLQGTTPVQSSAELDSESFCQCAKTPTLPKSVGVLPWVAAQIDFTPCV